MADKTPQEPVNRRCKLCPEGIFGSYGRGGRMNFRVGSLDLKSKILVLFLRVKSDQMTRNLNSSPLFKSQKRSDGN